MIASANRIARRSLALRWSTAAELMTPNPLSFHEDDSIQKVAALLGFHELDSAPVVDHAGRLMGLVSAEACAAWEEYSRRSSPHGLWAEFAETETSEIVNPIVETLREDASGQEVIETLGAFENLDPEKSRRIYVIDAADELVGVISTTDVLRKLGNGSVAKPVQRAAAALLC